MPTPSVDFTRLDGQTGTVRPSAEGVLAIIAPSEKGTLNTASSFARSADVYATFGDGPLFELAAYVINVAKKPVVCIRPTTSTAAAYSAITSTVGGTSVATAGATAPYDSYDVRIEFVTGGVQGTAGITYRYSLDGGKSKSPIQALGVATSIVIPRSNVTVALGTGTISAGRVLTFTTTQAKSSASDLIAAYEALRVTSSPWDCVLVETDADSAVIAGLDFWLSGLEASGKVRCGFLNTRRKGSAESEATYQAAMAVITNAGTSLRVVVGADGGLLQAAPARGLSLFRPTSWAVAARAMAVDISVEPAYVADGPVAGFTLNDSSGNPTLGHDEALFPNLDSLKLTTLRSFADRAGTYITNTNILSPEGSDYVYLPHARVISRAMEITFGVLTTQLSIGVDKNPTAEPNGAVYILESEAAKIEALVQVAVEKELGTRVSGVRFVLSRTDDLGSNGPGTLTGQLQIQAKSYIKRFALTSTFVRDITASAQ